MSPRPAVFLDRDDTIIDNAGVTEGTPHPGDLCDPALVRLLPGAARACAALGRAGYALVVVSNQSCIGRGVCTPAQVESCNDAMRRLLRAEGVRLDGVYIAPHHPAGRGRFAGDHEWRKPGAGMVLAAAGELGLDLRRSWVVGDAPRDAQAGATAGIAPERCLIVGARGSFRDLEGAAGFIVGQGRVSGR